MDWAEEPQILDELATSEKLLHPTEDDEKPLEKNPKPRADPPSLCSFHAPITPAYAFKEIIFHLVKYLSFKDVLRCRLVCRDLSDAVDQQLEQNYEISPQSDSVPVSFIHPHPSLFLNCRIHTSPVGPHLLEGIHLLDTPTLKQFLLKMASHKRNPFVSRCVRFGNYGDTHYNSGYWDTAMAILKKFGGHIWHVELSDGHEPVPDPQTCYKLIRQCLTLMPNLKSLEISFTHNETSEGENNKLTEYLKENPMPELPMLEKIEWNEQKVALPIQDIILSTYSKQVKAIASPVATFILESDQLQFPNLVELYLTNVTNNDCLVNLGWCRLASLKRLYLDLGGERCSSCGDLSTEVWSVESIFHLVSQFQLNFLSLFLAPGSRLQGSKKLIAEEGKIDCLKTLEVQHCENTSYEFLKCFTNLEYIHFFDIHHPIFPERIPDTASTAEDKGSNDGNNNDCKQGQMENNGEKETTAVKVNEETESKDENTVEIEEFIYKGDMYESNVWEVVPTLQLVTFKCVWDREGKNLISIYDWYRRPAYDRYKIKLGGVVSRLLSSLWVIFPF